MIRKKVSIAKAYSASDDRKRTKEQEQATAMRRASWRENPDGRGSFSIREEREKLKGEKPSPSSSLQKRKENSRERRRSLSTGSTLAGPPPQAVADVGRTSADPSMPTGRQPSLDSIPEPPRPRVDPRSSRRSVRAAKAKDLGL